MNRMCGILLCGDKVDVSGGVCVVEEGDSGFKSREFTQVCMCAC